MKKFRKINIYIALMATICFITSCIKTPDDPEIDVSGTIPVGYDKYTLGDLKNLSLPYTFDSAVSVYATVTMDEVNGNIYKQLYVQDQTGGMRLMFTESTGFLVGDSMRIYLKGKKLINNNGTYEIQTLQPDSNIVVLANKRYITPPEVTIDQINARNYDLMVVKVMNCEFSDIDLGTTWADTTLTTSAVNHTLQDCSGNSILLRTSSYASFAGQKVPSGNGSMIAIVGVYGTTMQLWTRTLAETKLTNTRCDGSTGEDVDIFMESFAEGQGNFAIVDKLGTQTWKWEKYGSSSGYMKMSGNAGQNFANEDWLISPSIDLTVFDEIRLSFDHAGRLFGAPFTNLTLWVSSNYDDNFDNAQWTEIPIPNYMTGDNWVFVNSGKIDLSSLAGEKNAHFSFKYVSTNTLSGTWEIKNVMMKGLPSESKK